MPKTWTDQPDAVADLDAVSLPLRAAEALEVRADACGRTYFTVGNLFGSDTTFIDDLTGPKLTEFLSTLITARVKTS